MSARRALQAIAIISLFGVLFSGALVYREFSGSAAAASCTALGAPGTILGFPPCVYGLVMYSAVFVMSLLGLSQIPDPVPPRAAHDEAKPGPVEARR